VTGVAVALFVFLVLGLMVAALGIMIWGLVDCATRPEWAYAQARSSKVLWLLLIVFLGTIPAIIYLATVRPRLLAVQRDWQLAAGGAYAQSITVPATGWFADPTGRHQLRFWSYGVWTDWVADGSYTSQDPPTP